MSEVEDELLMKNKYKRYHITIGFIDGIVGIYFEMLIFLHFYLLS